MKNTIQDRQDPRCLFVEHIAWIQKFPPTLLYKKKETMKELELNKIHNVDCLEFMKTLPDKCIDLVLTDPPYGINVGKPIERERES